MWKRERSMFQVARRGPVERKQLKLCGPAEKESSGQEVQESWEEKQADGHE